MRFRLFGAVQAISEGEPVDVGRRRERGLLALLLLDAGRPVSIDHLIDLLCDENTPEPRKALQVHVSRLRKRLPDLRLDSLATGYLLHADPQSVDVHQFTRLIAEARQCPDPAEKARLAREALSLQRGPVCADLTSAKLRRHLHARFDEICVSALELRVEAELALGGHQDLISELAELTARYPTRESLVAARMTALYRSGRARDALTVYRETARNVADELGIDPSPELRDLYTAILREAPELGASRGTAPAQLPAGLRTFTGRQDELTELLAAHDADTVVITAIGGMAGVGKTALAVHAAHRLAADYPDGQLFVDLHGFTRGTVAADPAVVLDRLLRALGVLGDQIPHDLEDRAGLFRSRLAGKRVLLVLDNAETESQVRPLLPATPGCLALITSRRQLTGLEHARPIQVDILDPADATTLFVRVAGVKNDPLITEIVELCGRLPLAIHIAAARLRARPSWTLAHLCGRLRDERHRLMELETGQRSVPASFRLSYQHLTAQQRHLFWRLGQHPGPDIDDHAAAALAGIPLAEATRLLEDLLDAHLLLQQRPGRYQMHDLLRAFAAQIIMRRPGPGGLTSLFDHYLGTAVCAAGLVYPLDSVKTPGHQPSTFVPGDPAQAAAWLDVEHENLLAVATHAAEHGWPAVVGLSAALHHHLWIRGRYAEARVLHADALRLARASGDHAGEHVALRNLGDVYRRQAQFDLAAGHFEQSLTIAGETGDRIGELRALWGLGDVCGAQARYIDAGDCFTRSLAIAQEVGDRAGELRALWGLGGVHRLQGRYDQATNSYRRAFGIAREIGDRSGEHTALWGLAGVLRLQGKYDQAVDLYRQALDLARSIGDRGGEPKALYSLGEVFRLQGEYERAKNCYRQALAIAREIGDRDAEHVVLYHLGAVHRLEGVHTLAGECLEQSLAIAREVGNRNGQFEALHGLGYNYHAIGSHDAALAHHREALAIADDLDQRHDQARAHDGLAQAHEALGQLEQACEHWQQSLTRYAELGTPDAGQIRGRLARLRDAKA